MGRPHGGHSGLKATDNDGRLHVELLARSGLLRRLHVVRTLDGNSVGSTIEGAVSWSRQHLRNDASVECAEVYIREGDVWAYRGTVARDRSGIVWQAV